MHTYTILWLDGTKETIVAKSIGEAVHKTNKNKGIKLQLTNEVWTQVKV